VILAGYGQVHGVGVLVFVEEAQMAHFRRFSLQKDTLTISRASNFVAIRFDFFNTSVCCVCCLLAEGANEGATRIAQINQITTDTHFDEIHHTPAINDPDYQFWFGNLNFMIDLPFNEVTARIQNNDLDVLFNHDQLTKARKAKALWPHHTEPKITFRPTYKYAVGTDLYDNQDKTIAPAWCDRILYCHEENPAHEVSSLIYSHGKLYISDHRPVKGLFDLSVCATDPPCHSLVLPFTDQANR